MSPIFLIFAALAAIGYVITCVYWLKTLGEICKYLLKPCFNKVFGKLATRFQCWRIRRSIIYRKRLEKLTNQITDRKTAGKIMVEYPYNKVCLVDAEIRKELTKKGYYTTLESNRHYQGRVCSILIIGI